MTNNQEKIREIEKKVQNYFAGLWSNGLLAYQVAFLERFSSGWKRSNNREEKLTLIKRILKENQEKNLEDTSSPPYCPTELQGLLQEWLIVHLEVEFQAQVQQT